MSSLPFYIRSISIYLSEFLKLQKSISLSSFIFRINFFLSIYYPMQHKNQNNFFMHPTFIPGSVSWSGLQYTGTGTGCRVGALGFPGRLQPQACSRPSSFLTCALTWRYCSLLSFALLATNFSEDLWLTIKRKILYLFVIIKVFFFQFSPGRK